MEYISVILYRNTGEDYIFKGFLYLYLRIGGDTVRYDGYVRVESVRTFMPFRRIRTS